MAHARAPKNRLRQGQDTGQNLSPRRERGERGRDPHRPPLPRSMLLENNTRTIVFSGSPSLASGNGCLPGSPKTRSLIRAPDTPSPRTQSISSTTAKHYESHLMRMSDPRPYKRYGREARKKDLTPYTNASGIILCLSVPTPRSSKILCHAVASPAYCRRKSRGSQP